MQNHALDLEKQANEPFSPILCQDLDHLLTEKYQARLDSDEQIRTKAYHGNQAVALHAQVGSLIKAHVFELVCESDTNDDIDAALALLIDYLDGVLEEFLQSKGEKWLPIDYIEKSFEGHTLWIKHNFVNFELEQAAETLLKQKTVK